MKSRRLRGFLTGVAASLCACGQVPPQSLGETRQPITSGTADDVDTSAVWIIAKSATESGYCSGVVVSPHVVLTAAHCTTADASFKYSIFLGPDYNDPAAQTQADNFVAVAEHHGHPKWDTSKGDVNDIGVLITATPIPRPAIPINRHPIEASDIGRAIRIVGYGQTSGSNKAIGRRNVGSTKIADFDATSLVVEGTPNICIFDSGGPTFMNQDGVDVIVGIHIVVSSDNCDAEGYDMRVDRYAGFVDQYVHAADPPVDAGAPRADASVHNDDATSTDAATPMPSPASSSGCATARSVPASTFGAFASLSALLVAWVLCRRRATSLTPS